MTYLLDTNICIYFLQGKYNLVNKIESVSYSQCSVSEITIAELKYGIEKSTKRAENRQISESFQKNFSVLPIYPCLDIYAKEKARL